MRRVVLNWVLAILAALAVGGTALGAVSNHAAADGPIYTVSQGVAGLRHDPRAWVGRIVSVSGLVELSYAMCGTPLRQCGATSYSLVEYPSYRPVVPIPSLPLHPEPDPLLNYLRQIPGLGRWIPDPQPVLGPGIYRLRLRSVAKSDLCFGQSCYEAVLPDAGLP